jgi:hypothetical protein
MNELERRIEAALEAKVGHLGRNSGAPPSAVSEIRRGRLGHAAAVFAGVLIVALGGFVATSSILGQRATQVVRPAAGLREEANVGSVDGRGTVIAAGKAAGAEYDFSAYVRDEAGEEKDALCARFRYKNQSHDDFACAIGWQDPMDPTSFAEGFWYLAPDGGVAVYGRVSREVSNLTLELDDGSQVSARIFDGGGEVDVPFNFFVGLPPDGTDSLTLVSRDSQGNELQRRSMSTQPQS